MNTRLANLMQKEVSRKQFLGMLVLATLSIFGFGTIIKLLTGKSFESHHLADGYGAPGYGSNRQQPKL